MPVDRTRIENPSAFGRLANSLSWEGILQRHTIGAPAGASSLRSLCS